MMTNSTTNFSIFIDKTDPPCQYELLTRHLRCEIYQTSPEVAVSVFKAFASFASMILNLFVILAIRQTMKQKRTQAQIHLMALAVSDWSVGFCFFCQPIWKWSCDLCLPCGRVKPLCFWMDKILFYLLTLFLSFNRVTNLYITLSRAHAVSSVQNAAKIRDKTPKSVVKELIIVVFIGSVLLLLIGYGLIMALRFEHAALIISSVCFLPMTIAAFFVIKKLRQRKSEASTLVHDEFQKLVVLVALFYCCTLIWEVVVSSVNLNAGDKEHKLRGYWRAFGHIINASVNLFIYLLASRSFRDSFIKVFRIDT